MKPGTRITVAPFLAVLILCLGAVAQDLPLQRYSSNVGRSNTDWTNDNGKTWKEMTLPAGAESLFFLNPATGWALITFDNGTGNPGFVLGTTHDGGATWAVTPVRASVNPNQIILPGQGQLQFTDEMHGWINLVVQSGSAFDEGILLKTVDGGKTWTRANGPGTSQQMYFINAQDGWQLGPHQFELWVTHDGAKTWRKVSVKPPPGAGPADEATFLLPAFGDEKHGAFLVAFSGSPTAPVEGCQLILYVSSDGGHHWNMSQVVSKQDGCANWWPYAVTGPLVITPFASNQNLTLKKTSLDGTPVTTTTTANLGFLSHVDRITFSSPNEGWVSVTACCEAACPTCALKPSPRVSCALGTDDNRPRGQQCGALLSTNDGGKTWTDITLRQTCVQVDNGPKRCTELK